MNKVLIIGPNYFNFLSATRLAFELLGWETQVCHYDNPIHPYTTWMKWKYKFSLNRRAMQRRSRYVFNTLLQQRFEEYKPSLVFILNGDIIETSTLDYFRQKAKVALWFFDSRTKLATSLQHVDHVDALFCFEQDDVDWYQTQGKQTYFLPQACDTQVYYPIGHVQKDIDILFIGNLFYSQRRQYLIGKIIEAFPNKRIRVFGLYRPWYKGLVKWLTMRHRNIYANRNLSPEQVNLYYNKSKVVLNIHQESQNVGANPRVFEICGSGTYQVCDANPYIECLFGKNDIGLYHNEKELVACIQAALATDMQANAIKAYQTTIRQHTFVNRIQTVLAIIGQI